MIGSMIGMCEGGGHADGMQSVAWSEASMSTGTLRTALEALARPGALLTHSELFILYTRYVMVWRVLVLGRMCVAPIHAWHAKDGVQWRRVRVDVARGRGWLMRDSSMPVVIVSRSASGHIRV